MKRNLMRSAMLLLALLLILPPRAAAAGDNPVIRVGLYYGEEALPSANLENSAGSGYAFGYFDGGLTFVPLASTGQTQITMLKTQNMYMSGGVYSETSGGTVIGCYHLQLPGSYPSFEAAQAAAAGYSGGFAAWAEGSFYARVGAFATRSAAEAAQQGGMTIVGTSSYGISVVATKTGQILFQFDGGAARAAFAVSPNAGGGRANTWFKGYKYYGDFVYERIGGGNLTVSNVLPLEDYVRGVLPYEMSNSWPLEALKAQAVCARTYASLTISKARHTASHFDICNTTHCQVYRGNNSANERTDQAVNETLGVYARYGGGLAETYYFSCDGGGTEDVRNVWNSTANLPYLAGVIDPYEAQVASLISNYNWTVTFTASELAAHLQSKGYNCKDIATFQVTGYTPTGNVREVVFGDSTGKTWTITRESVRTLFGLRSMRYSVAGDGQYYINGGGSSLDSLSGSYAINGKGEVGPLPGGGLYAATGSGTSALTAGASGDRYVITGSGWGHHVGMSQWGANAMAKQGFSYRDILTFYFTGIEVY